MRDSEKVNWRVPTATLERFREYVREENGSVDGYFGREVETAMKEYADADGFGEVEAAVDNLVQAAGRTPDKAYKQKTDLSAEETTRCHARVDSTVKDQFRATADQREGGGSYGIALARALDTAIDGGRSDRILRKIRRIEDDFTGVLSEIGKSDSEETLTTRQKRTIAICERLPEQFPDEELAGVIEDVAGETVIDEYRSRVVERRGLERHPTNPDLWVPEEVAAEIADDGVPRECRRSLDLLDRSEKVTRLQLEIGRRAFNRRGKAQMAATDVDQAVFDGEPARATVLKYMESAGRKDGFTFDRSGENANLRVDLSDLGPSDGEMIDTIREYADGGDDTPDERDESDGDRVADEPEESSHEAPAEDEPDDWGDGHSFDALEAATREAVTDGGRDLPSGGGSTDAAGRDGE